MKPSVADDVPTLRQAVADARRAGRTIGLVPTMGALHAGHRSLLEAARRETGFVVCSVFVNPIQFGPQEDLGRYPRTFEQDLQVCSEVGVDLVFAPSVEAMYPEGFRTYVEVAGFQDVLCGASRPGHFRGVATVVLKLFNQVQPDRAYFGRKDAQQARIIEQMVRDLDVPVRVCVEPTVREPDGLALSSRNRYLDPDQRARALVLSRALHEVQARIEAGERDANALRELLRRRLREAPGVELDYADIVNYQTLTPLTHLAGPVLIAGAIKVGTTRLIDNVFIDCGMRNADCGLEDLADASG
jgi:pantoate--beta-alanine ligase